MKTLANVKTVLEAFEAKYPHLQVKSAQQGSVAWLMLKMGVLSASNATKIVAKKDSETRLTYLAELVGQVCTGEMKDIDSAAIDWGRTYEDEARSTYEFAQGVMTIPVPFVFMDDTFRVGCSPDGIVSENKGHEIKCPYNTGNYIKFLAEEKIKSEYVWQAQFSMYVTEAELWDMSQYDPRMRKSPLHTVTIERDEKAQATLADAVPQFIADMDKMLEKIGIPFGDQWERLAVSGSEDEALGDVQLNQNFAPV
ncbi:MAG: YqaJ viral recombinase family protein [Bdellovibrio sp.]|nr:YqaJ viral recombinase family protein [Bdellovibrio sp.]